uniref:Uncharacterized protein n=1 Tax=uncultured marine virus TaxID=186617 RepID=A0A0F7L648_9VIRU|nr:hypothetical protein [uncultured marine virus]
MNIIKHIQSLEENWKPPPTKTINRDDFLDPILMPMAPNWLMPDYEDFREGVWQWVNRHHVFGHFDSPHIVNYANFLIAKIKELKAKQ